VSPAEAGLTFQAMRAAEAASVPSDQKPTW